MKKFWHLVVFWDSLLIMSLPVWAMALPGWISGMIILIMDLAFVTISLGITEKLDAANLVVYWFGNLIVLATILLFLVDVDVFLGATVLTSRIVWQNLMIIFLWAVHFMKKDTPA